MPYFTGIISLMLSLGMAKPSPAVPHLGRNSDPKTRSDDSHVIHIVEWEGGQFPAIYERSDQLPLSNEDVVALTTSGFGASEISRLISERRYVGDASADGLIQLKSDGVAPEVLRAISRHALPPTRALRMTLQIGLEGNSPEARGRYLYVIIPDGEVERILTADLGELVARKGAVQVDRTDRLLPRAVREIRVNGTVPITNDGPREVLIVSSSRPDIWSAEDIPERDRTGVRTFQMDVPASSLNRDCRIRVRYRQDPLLPHVWKETGSRFQCEWK
jgi:hypothetical protein